MKSYLVTHGDRFFGPNPGHTEKGFNQLRRLAPMIPDDISLFVVGTGRRFREIHETILGARDDLFSVLKKSSPFCGSADGLEADGKTVVLADEGISVDLKRDYIGLDSPCFDAWGFMGLFPKPTLYCTGGELLIALGYGNIKEKGQLYEITFANNFVRKIS